TGSLRASRAVFIVTVGLPVWLVFVLFLALFGCLSSPIPLVLSCPETRFPILMLAPPFWMMLTRPIASMTVPPILVAPFIAIPGAVTVLPGSWTTHSLPVAFVIVQPILQPGMLLSPVRVV